MKTKSYLLLTIGLLGLATHTLRAQVGINNSATTPDASAILDLKSGNAGVNKGFLPQSVALTNIATAAPVTSPATGLIVYSSTAPTGGNGKGYYYWDGTAWASLNSGSGINKHVALWTPNNTTLGSSSIQDSASFVSIDTVPFPDVALFVNGDNGTEVDIYGYNHSTGYGYGVAGIDENYVGVVGISSLNNTAGVYGSSDTGYGVLGASDYGTGVYAEGDSVGLIAFGDTAISARGTVNGINAYGITYGINDTGYVGENAVGAGGIQAWGSQYQGVYGYGASWGLYAAGADASNSYGGVFAADYGSGYGVDASSTGGYGVYATTTDAGGNHAGVYGSDGGAGTGVQGYSSTGNGAYFSDGKGDNGSIANNSNGFGGWFFDAAGDYGRVGDALDGAAATFENAGGTTYIYLCKGSSGFITPGTKSTEVKDENNQERLLFCNESPEVMFEDYGEGQLVNGKAHISIDPLFAKNVAVNDKHPLRVYVQLEGDCNGVYVTNKSANGFDVKELKHGNSNVSFQWHIVCNRASEAGEDKNYADKRFPIGPGAPAAAVQVADNNKVKAEEAQKAAYRVANPGVTSKVNAPKKAGKRVVSPLKAVALPGNSQAQVKN